MFSIIGVNEKLIPQRVGPPIYTWAIGSQLTSLDKMTNITEIIKLITSH